MSKDKYMYLSIFSYQMEAIVFVILQNNMFCNTHSFESWGISLGYYPVLAGVYSVT